MSLRCLYYFLFLALSMLPLPLAKAQEQSTITVPVVLSVAALQEAANRDLPVELHTGERAQQCVKAQEACTKIPEFRGLKIYSRRECIQVSPAIDCTIRDRVWREGTLSVTGDEGQLLLQQTVRAQATVSGRGEIGKYIRETVNGAARFEIHARPEVKPDWTASLPLDVRFDWTERPNVVLFGVIPVTFGSQAGEKLEQEIADFQQNDLPGLLDEFDLRGRLEKVWLDLQKPQKIEIPDAAPLYLHVRPGRLGLAPLIVTDRQIETALSLTAELRGTDSIASPFGGGAVALPDRTPVPVGDGFDVVLPVTVGFDALNRMFAKELEPPKEFQIPAGGKIIVSAGSLSGEAGRLAVRLNTSISGPGLPRFDGPVLASSQLRWEAASERISFIDLEIKLEKSSMNAFVLNGFLNSPPVRGWIEKQAIISLEAEFRKVESQIAAELSRELAAGIKTEVENVEFSIEELGVEQGLDLKVRAQGKLRILGVL